MQCDRGEKKPRNFFSHYRRFSTEHFLRANDYLAIKDGSLSLPENYKNLENTIYNIMNMNEFRSSTENGNSKSATLNVILNMNIDFMTLLQSFTEYLIALQVY